MLTGWTANFIDILAMLGAQVSSSTAILLATSYLIVSRVMAGVTNVDDLNLATFARQDDLIS